MNHNKHWCIGNGLEFPPLSAMSCRCCRGEIEGLTWGWSLPAWPEIPPAPARWRPGERHRVYRCL